jgi:hypothetical protein
MYYIGKVKGKNKSSKTKCEIEKEIRKIVDKKKRKAAWIAHHQRVAQRYGEFQHQTGKGGKDKKGWRTARRVLVSCHYDDWGPRETYWVTNILNREPEDLINNVYSRRANAELRIKDAKEFRCDKLSCQSFVANQFRLLMHVLAQRLMFLLRSKLPAAAQRMTLSTVRERFVCIPAIVETRSREIVLMWSVSFPQKNLMHALCSRLTDKSRVSRRREVEFREFSEPIVFKTKRAA